LEIDSKEYRVYFLTDNKKKGKEMKTVKQGSIVERVKDVEADRRVKAGWAFCPKSEHKKGSGKAKEPVQEVKSEKVEKPKSKKGDKAAAKKAAEVAQTIADMK